MTIIPETTIKVFVVNEASFSASQEDLKKLVKLQEGGKREEGGRRKRRKGRKGRKEGTYAVGELVSGPPEAGRKRIPKRDGHGRCQNWSVHSHEFVIQIKSPVVFGHQGFCHLRSHDHTPVLEKKSTSVKRTGSGRGIAKNKRRQK
jgi:hypothetical protein